MREDKLAIKKTCLVSEHDEWLCKSEFGKKTYYIGGKYEKLYSGLCEK